MAYAFRGSCDSPLRASGADALGAYSDVGATIVRRFGIESGEMLCDELEAHQLATWIDGRDPATGELRGRGLTSSASDLVLDCTINGAKSFSIAALLHPDIARAYEALQDRLRDRIIATWARELNARRGAGGRIRERIERLEVVELQHRRSRALDPHIHRHLWLNVRVRGADGKWCNVDSRVAMRVQNLINAEGELAVHTDPEWTAALAANGFCLNADGEIAQLAHLVPAMSRRSNQIEANRAMLLEQWRSSHPGASPTVDVVRVIDRHAWALNRPGKPDVIDEDEWSARTKQELLRLDASLLTIRAPRRDPIPDQGEIDVGLLARLAMADADRRSRGCNGRFSVLDIRAGATRAAAASGIVSDREHLQNLIDDVTVRALAHTRDLIPDDQGKPQHVKALVTNAFAQLKLDLGARLTSLSNARWARPLSASAANATLQRLAIDRLDPSQRAAASAVAGLDRLVTITGPAGTGKTTMLRVAREALSVQGSRLLLVAPTRKAAAVAGREIGTAGTSIHALLADHGWRWSQDDAGADAWWRLNPGQSDPVTGRVYRGPQHHLLDGRTRIVVDEAGMLDLHAADALTRLALETGAGMALVGDPNQASPVGHSGAMALAARRAGRAIELTGVHRFEDASYAALTLRLRSPRTKAEALGVALELQERHHVRRVDDLDAAHAALVQGYFRHHARGQSVAVVTATNEEASVINDAIQRERVVRQQISTKRIAVGSDEQRILEGDVVQTRRNDRNAGVENRAIWRVARIGAAALELQRVDDAADIRVVSRDYAADYVQLAYATTVHGIQGETTDTSLVGPGVDASGLYVGLTRGRRHNEIIVVAHSDDAARDEIANEMMRGLPEPDLADAASAANQDLRRSARAAKPILSRTAPELHQPKDPEIQRLTEWLRAARAALLTAAAEDADNDARTHGREAVASRRARATLDSATRRRVEERVHKVAALEARHLDRYLIAGRTEYRESTSASASPGPAAGSDIGGVQ